MNIIKQRFQSDFYKTLLGISLPVIVQNFISSSLNLVDTVMIGAVGKNELAAVGLANQLFFLLMLLIYGINNGAGVLIAQYWGKKDESSIKKFLGVGLVFSVLISALFFLFGFFKSEMVMRLLIKEKSVVTLGSEYLHIISISYIITGVSFAYSIAARSVEKAAIPAIVSGIALSINTFLNYVLIFGKFGAPALGVKGAAIATTVARGIEFVMLLSIIYYKKNVLAASLQELLSFTKESIKRFYKVSFPVIMSEGFWALGNVLYAVAIAKISSDAVAVYQVSNSVYRFYEVVFIGFASAAQVMVGNKIGAGEPLQAKEYAYKILKIAQSVCVVLALVLFFSSTNIIQLFNLSSEVKILGQNSIKVFAIFSFFKVFNLMMIVGVLRGGGDTKFAMCNEIGSVWLIGVPMAFIGSLVLNIPVYWVIALILLEELIKAFINLYRLKSNRWVINVID